MPATILFAISDTGGGHRSAAVAIMAALEQADGAVTSDMLDVLCATGIPGLRSAPRIYDQLSTRWLPLYDFSFQLTNGVRRVDMLSRIVYFQARRSVTRAIRAAHPQLVVVTHPLVHRLVAAVRHANNWSFRIVTVVTDLVSLHASWTYSGVDLCLVPTDEAYALMRRRGIRQAMMQRTGFPVHPKFSGYAHTQAETRRKLGLAADRFTVLVTGGGVGSGNLRDMVLALAEACPDTQLLVVTGKNKAVYQELTTRLHNPLIHVYGFVDNMEELMAACDVVVSKAGPGTLMEALVMRRPVILTQAVGMQERGNIDFVLNHELGMFCPTPERIIDAVHALSDPQRYAATLARLEDAVPRDGAAQIAAILLDQLTQGENYAMARPIRRRLPLPRLRGWGRTLRRMRGSREG